MTRMSDSSSQRESESPHRHSLDGEPDVSPRGETSFNPAYGREGEVQLPEPTVADERFFPPLKLEVARYEELLADIDMSEEERAAILEAMWNIVVSFVDLGFDLHPLSVVRVFGTVERVI